MNNKEMIARGYFEDIILDLVDNQNNLTRSDLQSIVGAIVNSIIAYAKTETSEGRVECEHLYRDASAPNYCVDCGEKLEPQEN